MKILRNYSERHFETKLQCEKDGATSLALHSGRCATHRNENAFEKCSEKKKSTLRPHDKSGGHAHGNEPGSV